MKTIIEPFRIKAVEPIRLATPEQREEVLREAGFNLFKVAAEDVLIDLLTDSGTGAMSAQQWAAVMRADESYAGSTSFLRLRETVGDIMGFERMLPTHQGRASERILFDLIGGEGRIVPNNAHFDTTRANVEHSGAQAVDLAIPEAADPTNRHPFKGNLDLDRLESLLAAESARVPVVMCTVTSNTSGGQPVSLQNLRGTRDLCRQHGVPLFLDAARFAENAWFIKEREAGQQERSARDIAREMFDLADGATISAKKDGIVNIGGLLLLRDEELFRRASELTILTEGYVTYGGLAGRDLEAMALGFREVLDEDYLRYRIRSTTYVGDKLLEAGIQIVEPPGGHAIYIDGGRFCPHLSREQLPGQALAVALYRHAGIRTCEVGTVMFGARQAPPIDLVRLAVPRRVYTQSHMDYVVEALIELFAKREEIPGLRIVEAPEALPHFSARFEEV